MMSDKTPAVGVSDQDPTAHIALIKAHTLHELWHTPQSVTAKDRLFLLNEIDRLNRIIYYLSTGAST